MARFRYQHIKSSVEGKAPTAAQLKVAEIGVNDFAGDDRTFNPLTSHVDIQGNTLMIMKESLQRH